MNKVERWLFDNLYFVWSIYNWITLIPYMVRYDIPYFFRRIKWFYQRGKNRYSDDMFWQLDEEIKNLYKKGLSDLVKKWNGYPTKYTKRSEWENELNKILLVLNEEEPNLHDYKFQFSRYHTDLDIWHRKQIQAYKKLADLHFHLWD